MLVWATSPPSDDARQVQLVCPAGTFVAVWHGSELPRTGQDYRVELSCSTDLAWVDDHTLTDVDSSGSRSSGSGALVGQIHGVQNDGQIVVSILGTPTMLSMAPGQSPPLAGALVTFTNVLWDAYPHDREQPQPPQQETPTVPDQAAAPARPSLLLVVVQVLLVVVVAGLAIAAGLNSAPATLFVMGVGGALIVVYRFRRSLALAAERHPESAAYPLLIPCHRMIVGSSLWFSRPFLEARRMRAAGVLGVDRGRVEFFPNRPRHDDRAWSAATASADVFGPRWYRFCAVRVHGRSGTAQFAVQLPREELRALVAPFLLDLSRPH